SKKLTRSKINRTITHTEQALKKQWGIKKPKIAVLALNPHAGESGLFGNEEKKIISPEIKRLSSRIKLSGPHPADTFFAQYFSLPKTSRPDAVVAMYHDQ